MTTAKFSNITAPIPTLETLASAYAALNALLDDHELEAALTKWETLRRDIDTWNWLAHLRFEQNTKDEAAKIARDYRDELLPTVTNFETAFKRRLLALEDRNALAHLTGKHALDLWEMDVTTFTPDIEDDLKAEARLDSAYTELLASAQIEIDGNIVNLEGISPFEQNLDRDTRHRAMAARWKFFADNAAAFDQIYDDMVKLRHGMAQKLGYKSYTELAYRKMRRVDYNASDVAKYREQVLAHVVPLVAAIMEGRRKSNGWDKLHAWDEPLTDPLGNPKPAGAESFLRAQGQKMFDAMAPEMASFFKAMNEGGFLDLDNRPTKAPGGFCTSFPNAGMPFIFANFNGTHHDIDVLTHEMGHAFQNFASRGQPNFDYLWPTMESAEIHSMALEYLAHPHINLLVGDDAAPRYRRMHLIESLAFLPYGVLVDHFQHEIYANPEATPAERHAIWKSLEKTYMPWRDYGDIGYPAMGARWQAQGHIYGAPFYYIDYTLALCCALQFWIKSNENYNAAMRDYIALCEQGGAAPFQSLVNSAGLLSPFADGALAKVVEQAKAELV
jgi:M3 family oligoendopeptidase